MSDLSSALHNLAAQEPLRKPDGSWNLAIILDRRHVSPQSNVHLDRIGSIARQMGVPCQEDWSSPPSNVHALCIIGHNHVELRRDLLDWGRKGWVRGCYLFLLICGRLGETVLTPEQLNEVLHVAGSITFAHQIELTAATLILEQLLLST